MNEFQTNQALRFSDTLDEIRSSIEQSPVKLRLDEVISLFGPMGHPLLTLFFTLPFLQPIPIPVLSSVLGICICFFGVFMFLGRAPWIPSFIARFEVEKKFLLRLTFAVESLLKKVEHLARPRHRNLFQNPKLRSFHGLIVAWNALLLALPLPIPFSNMSPAIGLGLVALGTLEEDFALVILGYLMTIVTVCFLTAVIIVPFLLHHSWAHG